MAKRTSILIIDDDRRMCETLKDVLIEKGYEADFTESSIEAFRILEKKVYEIILLDLKMPIMDGLEAFKRIKKISPTSTTIMMTAFSLEEKIKACLREGAFGVLYKPLDIDKVIAQIEAAKNGILVMVVDDAPNIRKTLKDILEEKGFRVSVVKDGEEAIKRAKEVQHNIIVVDMKLPALNGLETYLAIKEINPRVKCILMTAYKEETKELVKEALEKNAYTCLYKPFDPGYILDIIREISEKKRKSISV